MISLGSFDEKRDTKSGRFSKLSSISLLSCELAKSRISQVLPTWRAPRIINGLRVLEFSQWPRNKLRSRLINLSLAAWFKFGGGRVTAATANLTQFAPRE